MIIRDEYIKIVNKCSEKFKIVKFQTDQVFEFKKMIAILLQKNLFIY